MRHVGIEVDDALASAEEIHVRTPVPRGHALPALDRAFRSRRQSSSSSSALASFRSAVSKPSVNQP